MKFSGNKCSQHNPCQTISQGRAVLQDRAEGQIWRSTPFRVYRPFLSWSWAPPFYGATFPSSFSTVRCRGEVLLSPPCCRSQDSPGTWAVRLPEPLAALIPPSSLKPPAPPTKVHLSFPFALIVKVCSVWACFSQLHLGTILYVVSPDPSIETSPWSRARPSKKTGIEISPPLRHRKPTDLFRSADGESLMNAPRKVF